MTIPLELYTGDAIGVLIDWNRDDAYDHVRSDASTYYGRLRFAIGSSRRANPQRPNMNAGAGRLTLIGEDFVPGRSGVLTEAQLRRRNKIKLNLGAIGQFEGWLQEGRSRDGNATEFKLEGLLERRGRQKREISQPSVNALATNAAVVQLLEDAYGLDSIPVNLSATPLTAYSFDGPVARYASQFAQVAGGLPTARGDGGMVVRDPNRRPAGIQTFRSSDYVVLDASAEFDIEQLRNILSVIYPNRIMDRVASGVSPQQPGSVSGALDAVEPVSGPDVLKMNSQAESQLSGRAGYPVTLTAAVPSGANAIISGQFRIRVAKWRHPSQGDITPPESSVDAGLYDQYVPGVVQDDGSLRGTIADRLSNPLGQISATWRDSSTPAGAVVVVWYQIAAEMTVEVPGQNPIKLNNAASVAEYDPRELTIPGWIQGTASASLQARIDDLAQPRSIFTQGYSMLQGDADRTRAIARLQPGDHIGVFDRDPPSETDINAIVYIMLVEYDLRRGQLPIKRIVGLQSGTGLAVDHHPVYAGSADNQVFAGSTDHPVYAHG